MDNQLAKLKDEHQPICRVPVIASPEEEHLIVSTSTKVRKGHTHTRVCVCVCVCVCAFPDQVCAIKGVAYLVIH